MPEQSVAIDRLMARSGVGFGTSGARGLVEAMSDRVCYAYTRAFIAHLQQQRLLPTGGQVVVAGDLRPSTPRILTACAAAIGDAGCQVVNGGAVPTPAVTLYGLQRGWPSLMVTGSHIPDDRNGIKFNRPDGEILKPDEQAIRGQRVALPDGRFDIAGGLLAPPALPPVAAAVARHYLDRYLELVPGDALAGLRVGVYEHSSVARDMLVELLAGLGAEPVRLGRSARFIPVDTEAVRPEDVQLARDWSKAHRLDALVSTDGDGDRPLIADEQGRWLRGDVAGILCARYLGVRRVVTPVSSNSAVEGCGWFEQVVRTRIGSPHVIAAMRQVLDDGYRAVAGYEANGGFLLADDLALPGGRLSALPTRDALVVVLALLLSARAEGCALSRLLEALPPRFTASDRLQAFPSQLSRQRIESLAGDPAAIEAQFGELCGQVSTLDNTDGLRITFDSGEIIHLRPSGNAPELRCYTEAASTARAVELNRQCLDQLEGWRGVPEPR